MSNHQQVEGKVYVAGKGLLRKNRGRFYLINLKLKRFGIFYFSGGGLGGFEQHVVYASGQGSLVI